MNNSTYKALFHVSTILIQIPKRLYDVTKFIELFTSRLSERLQDRFRALFTEKGSREAERHRDPR